FYVADFHRRIAELAKGASDEDAKLSRLAAEFRQALESSKNVWHEDEEDHEWNEYEEELDRLKAKAREILDKDGSEAAARFYNAATGQATLLKDHDSVSIEEVTRKKAGEYVTDLMNTSGFARATARRHVSSLSSLWRWLKGRGVAGDNPWLGQQLGKKQEPDRKRLSEDALLKLLKGRYSTPKFAQVLSDLLRLALLHGARLEELCALKRSDVHKREDGY
ncbi:tyrosine-type recombinase/integrase, partial [Aduncisulcus paluster]